MTGGYGTGWDTATNANITRLLDSITISAGANFDINRISVYGADGVFTA